MRLPRWLRRDRLPKPLPAIWVRVYQHGIGPKMYDYVPIDGRMHRLAWRKVPNSTDVEFYVDGERVD